LQAFETLNRNVRNIGVHFLSTLIIVVSTTRKSHTNTERNITTVKINTKEFFVSNKENKKEHKNIQINIEKNSLPNAL